MVFRGVGWYCTVKAGLDQFAKVVALEEAEKGIRCNVVSPGATHTDIFYKEMAFKA